MFKLDKCIVYSTKKGLIAQLKTRAIYLNGLENGLTECYLQL